MALTPPTLTDLETFWGVTADDLDTNHATVMLDLATNLMWLATSLDDYPLDARLASLVRYAILDMAVYSYVQREDLEAAYSPFTSERVGSYSYSKMLKNVQMGIDTGVPLFDRVVEYFREQAFNGANGAGWTTSEAVFHTGFVPLLFEAAFFSTVWSYAGGGYVNLEEFALATDGIRCIREETMP